VSIVAADGVRLAGRWFPATENPRPGRVALLLHGFAESADALRAERTGLLRRAGWDVAAIDSRGYGQSGGAFASFGGREAADVSAWLDAIRARVGPHAPFTPVLWGRSMGATIALRAAAGDSRIRAMILESPMLDLNDAMAVWFRNRRIPFARLLARLVTRRASRLAGVSLTRPNALEAAPRVGCPVLILHGDDDRLVPTDQARRLAGSFPGPARFVSVPGAGHTDVLAVGGEAVPAEIAGFLATVP
jgi:pimeloyl-ACP methyl ester carboxylesterase